MSLEVKRYLPAEWHPQSAVHLTWPHKETDWVSNLDEVVDCFKSLAYEISTRQKLLIVCRDIQDTKNQVAHCPRENLIFAEINSNDSWARDHGPIIVFENGVPKILDFGFNGWGEKYPFELDNEITKSLYSSGIFNSSIAYEDHLDFILEGGSIESDGNGTILTTTSCLLSKGRNESMSKKEIETRLKDSLGANRILWLNHGLLIGDDTDGHIDTLARFCSEDTIAYVKCDDPNEEHYESLLKMEEQLKGFKKFNGEHYRLIPLPMAEPIYYEGNRLPATYTNFLIMNEAVLVPFYGSSKDDIAAATVQSLFPTKEVIGINCTSLVKQNGSLHCVTMQYPEEVL